MPIPVILDWGCGTGRIVQHLHHLQPYALLYGADINAAMIEWDHAHIKGVHFSLIDVNPPTTYPSNYFDLIYGISVLTHLPKKYQVKWMEEISRILKQEAILLATTHGNYFVPQLIYQERISLEKNGLFEKENHSAEKKLSAGDRNYTVYETAQFFEQLINKDFKIISHFDGVEYPDKFGGQDLWILQKK